MRLLHIMTASYPPPVTIASVGIRRSVPADTDLEFIFSRSSTGTPSTQAYSLHMAERRVIVSSTDLVGLMYFGLDFTDVSQRGNEHE